jgi:hypothetical protein
MDKLVIDDTLKALARSESGGSLPGSIERSVILSSDKEVDRLNKFREYLGEEIRDIRDL